MRATRLRGVVASCTSRGRSAARTGYRATGYRRATRNSPDAAATGGSRLVIHVWRYLSTGLS